MDTALDKRNETLLIGMTQSPQNTKHKDFKKINSQEVAKYVDLPHHLTLRNFCVITKRYLGPSLIDLS